MYRAIKGVYFQFSGAPDKRLAPYLQLKEDPRG